VDLPVGGRHPHASARQQGKDVPAGGDADGRRGEKRLMAIEEDASESAECRERVLRGLRLRGMNPPRLAIAGGAGGLREAPDRVFPETLLQRCWVHKERNIHSYMSPSTEEAASKALRDIWNVPSSDSAMARVRKFFEIFVDRYPKATRCLLDDLPGLLAFFDYPAAHWCRSARTTPSSRRSRPSATAPSSRAGPWTGRARSR